MSLEWFGPKKCNVPQLKTLNEFNKKSMKWNSKLRNHEKFLNFHGCELNLMIPKYREYEQETALDQVSKRIFRIASGKYKFKQNFVRVFSDFPSFLHTHPKDLINNIEGHEKTPNVYFELTDVAYSQSSIRTTNTITDFQYSVLVTPGELYTPYEKLLLPFDATTWLLIFVTFFATFVSIFIIDHMPEKIKDVVYGKKVRTPIWNVVGLIFGIGQTRLPDKSFARFLLFLFIWFCMIFQTCFQSKLFEFMTSEPRRMPPTTLNDLVHLNYSIYSLLYEDSYKIGDNLESHYVLKIHTNEFIHLFMTQSQNASARIALLINDFNYEFLKKLAHSNFNWNQIKYKLTSNQVFGFHEHAFSFRMLKKTIDSMIDTGQMKLLFDTYFPKSEVPEYNENEPKVLSMADLEFGFWIWIGCCCISISGFILELLRKLIKYIHVEFPTERPVSNVGTRYQSDQDESDDVFIEETDQQEPEQTDQENEAQNQEQEENSNENDDDTGIESEEGDVEVQAEVHQPDEMEKSLLYFEAIIDSNERQQSACHATDSPEAISSFMDIELLRKSSKCQENIETDIDKN